MSLAGRGAWVIDPRWNAFHRPTARATMKAECVITVTDGGGSTGPDGTYTPDAPDTLYAGLCRVLSLPLNEAIDVAGEEQETHHRYRVSVDHAVADIPIGAWVHITMAEDAGLIGKEFRVTSSAYGSEQWQRDLTCDEREA